MTISDYKPLLNIADRIKQRSFLFVVFASSPILGYSALLKLNWIDGASFPEVVEISTSNLAFLILLLCVFGLREVVAEHQAENISTKRKEDT